MATVTLPKFNDPQMCAQLLGASYLCTLPQRERKSEKDDDSDRRLHMEPPFFDAVCSMCYTLKAALHRHNEFHPELAEGDRSNTMHNVSLTTQGRQAIWEGDVTPLIRAMLRPELVDKEPQLDPRYYSNQLNASPIEWLLCLNPDKIAEYLADWRSIEKHHIPVESQVLRVQQRLHQSTTLPDGALSYITFAELIDPAFQGTISIPFMVSTYRSYAFPPLDWLSTKLKTVSYHDKKDMAKMSKLLSQCVQTTVTSELAKEKAGAAKRAAGRRAYQAVFVEEKRRSDAEWLYQRQAGSPFAKDETEGSLELLRQHLDRVQRERGEDRRAVFEQLCSVGCGEIAAATALLDYLCPVSATESSSTSATTANAISLLEALMPLWDFEEGLRVSFHDERQLTHRPERCLLLSAFAADGSPRVQPKVGPKELETHLVMFDKDWQRAPGAPMTQSLNEFLKNWDAFTCGVFDDSFDWTNIAVCGGAVAACLHPSVPSGPDATAASRRQAMHDMGTRDVDLFPVGLCTRGVRALIGRIEKHFFDRFGRDGVVTLVTSKNVTFVFEYPMPSVQIQLGAWFSVPDVLANADIDSAAVYFNAGARRVYWTLRGQLAWTYRINVPCRVHHRVRGSIGYEERLYKYAKRRGFAVLDPRMPKDHPCLAKIKPSAHKMLTTSAFLWLYLTHLGKFSPRFRAVSDTTTTPKRNLSAVLKTVQAEGYVESDNYGGHEEGYIYLYNRDTPEHLADDSDDWLTMEPEFRYAHPACRPFHSDHDAESYLEEDQITRHTWLTYLPIETTERRYGVVKWYEKIQDAPSLPAGLRLEEKNDRDFDGERDDDDDAGEDEDA